MKMSVWNVRWRGRPSSKIYVGESSMTGKEREEDHFDETRHDLKESHIWHHAVANHEGRIPWFQFKVVQSFITDQCQIM